MGAAASLLRDHDVSADDREALLAALVLTMLANGAEDLVDDDVRAQVAAWLTRHEIDLGAAPERIEEQLAGLLGGRPGLRSLAEACTALVVGEVATAESQRGQAATARLGGIDATANFARARSAAPPAGAVKASPLLRFQAVTPGAADPPGAASPPVSSPASSRVSSPADNDDHDT